MAVAIPPASRDELVGAHARATVLAAVQACAPTAAAVMGAYAVVSFAVGQAPPIIAALDAAAMVLLIGTAWFSRRSRRAEALAEAATTVDLGLIAGTTILRFALLGETICAAHLAIELFAVASVLVSRRWFYPFVAICAAAFVAVATRWLSGHALTEHALAVLSGGVVATIVFESRRRAVVTHGTLLWQDLEVRRDLEAALAAARRDLLDRQRAEAERQALREQLAHAQKLEAIGTLAGGIAHDMNNALASITVLGEVLCEDLPPASPLRRDAQDIVAAARRGADLTRNLLAFGRKGKYREEPMALAAVVQDVEQLLARTLPKDVRIEVATAGGSTAAIGDPTLLSHALLNICLNASDAMAHAGTIRLATERVALSAADGARLGVAPGPYVAVHVVDHGAGMDEATRQRAFEPFFTTKPLGQGTGLGLSMVYGTMQSHQGAVELESALGAGTTVSLYFPATEADAAASGERTAPIKRTGRGTVLVVDDEPLVRTTTSRAMTRLGYQVLLAAGGQEALDVIAKDPTAIDLVLLDMSMPGMGGAACFHQLRLITPEMRVVICSGYAASRETEDLLASGAAAFIEKPYSVRQLSELVQRVLGEPARQLRSAG